MKPLCVKPVRLIGVVCLGLIPLVVGACRATEVATPPAPTEPGAPPPPPSGAFLAQLSPEQTAELAELGVDVVVPGVVPPEFSAVEIRTQAGEGAPSDDGPYYAVIYQDGSSNRCFAVEFAATGVGDMPATENRLPLQLPLFPEAEYGLNYGPFAAADLAAQFPESNLHTDWLSGRQGAYRLVGATYINQTFESLSGCQDVSPNLAVSLAESLTVIAPEVVGDGEMPQ